MSHNPPARLVLVSLREGFQQLINIVELAVARIENVEPTLYVVESNVCIEWWVLLAHTQEDHKDLRKSVKLISAVVRYLGGVVLQHLDIMLAIAFIHAIGCQENEV